MKTTDSIRVVPARYPMRTVGAVIALFVLAVILQSVAFNPRWEWSVFARWFFDPVILSGLGQTLLLTLIGTLLSIVIGGLLCPKFSSRKAGFWTIMASIVSIVAWNMVPALVPVFKNVGFFMLAVCGAVFILISLVDPEKVKQ